MKEKANQAVTKAKDFWAKQSRRVKILLISAVGAVLALLLIAGILFSSRMEPKFKVLYNNMDSVETTEVYKVLQEKGVQAQMNNQGQILVPSEQWDSLIYELAGEGFPKTAMPYDMFLDHSGFTTTEFEKRQTLLFQLQDRMQTTLSRIGGVESAAVTINIPEEKTYIWEESSAEPSSASVLITMQKDLTLSPKQVTAIKNLVAFSVPQLEKENVTVMDAATGLELEEEISPDERYNVDRIDFERAMEENIEEKVRRVLSIAYPGNKMTVAATVVLDYDKMLTESNLLQEKENPDGTTSPYPTHRDDMFSTDGNQLPGGVVGEEDNTDIPLYQYGGATGNGDVPLYRRITDYQYGYIKTQVEHNNAKLLSSSVGVYVDTETLAANRRDELVDLVAKATSIPPENITVLGGEYIPPVQPDGQGGNGQGGEDEETEGVNWLVIAIAAGVLLLLLLILFLLILRARKKKKKNKMLQAIEAEKEAAAAVARTKEEEIAAYKKELVAAAQANVNDKETAIADEVREFAKENPEITANLIRSWLKED